MSRDQTKPATETTDVKLTPPLPAKEALAGETNPYLDSVKAITIDSPTMLQMAIDEARDINTKMKALVERRLEITRPMDAAKKSVMDLFAPPIATLESAVKIIKDKIGVYQDEQDALRLAAQRKANEEAEAERRKMQAEAEEAEQSGDMITAMAFHSASEAITAAPVETAPKATGASRSKRWSAEITDKKAFIEFALTEAGAQYFDAITIDMKPLNQMATALKDKMNIPGIKATATSGVTLR